MSVFPWYGFDLIVKRVMGKAVRGECGLNS